MQPLSPLKLHTKEPLSPLNLSPLKFHSISKNTKEQSQGARTGPTVSPYAKF